MAESIWLLMGVYGLFAVLLILLDRRTFFAKPAERTLELASRQANHTV